MKRFVYRVIYEADDEGLACVAVSAGSRRDALRRLVQDRPVNVLDAAMVVGRRPEWDQDRIEGTCYLLDPQAPPPEAGSPMAERVRASNTAYIKSMIAAGRIAR